MVSDTRKRTGGGRFDPGEGHIYFLASNVDRMQYGAEFYDYILTAVNELDSADSLDQLARWIDSGKKVLLDSGIFSLASNHARTHGLTHDQALALAPDDIDGFDALYERYLHITTTYGEGLWGYIELDQGGKVNKRKTRARLEAAGLRPIPVYHPLVDGWDYFDELAQGYDRICLGNIVQAPPNVRLRLLATMHERIQAYPGLWVHALGLTPNTVAYSYPTSSADSSSWLSGIRWSGLIERAAGASLGTLPKDFQYVLGSDPDGPAGNVKATRMSGYASALQMQNWRQYAEAMDRLGGEGG